jgi:hypothetical protein
MFDIMYTRYINNWYITNNVQKRSFPIFSDELLPPDRK